MNDKSLVVGVGLVNKDFLAFVPAWERDHKVEATELIEQVGGPIPVALTAMTRLGRLPQITRYEFIGVLGEDMQGDEVRHWLTAEGVGTGYCQSAPGVRTSCSVVIVDERDGSRTLANYAEALPPLEMTREREELLAEAALVHLDGRDLPACLRAAEIVKAAGGIVSYDLGTMREGRDELFRFSDIILASRKGGAGAFPDVADNPTEQVRRFLERGATVAGVTLGQEGVVIGRAGEEPVHRPVYPVATVADTCGAGDTFHGAYLWAYLSQKNAIASADFAQAAVSLRIQHRGNRAGLPNSATVATCLQK